MYERGGDVQTFSVETRAARDRTASGLLASTREHLTNTLRVFQACHRGSAEADWFRR